MNFKFKLGDTALDNSEAKALLSAAGKEAAIMIDIAEHVDPAMIDAKKLFSISVETKNPTLASLAARFAIEGVSAPGKRQYRRTDAQRISRWSLQDLASALYILCKRHGLPGFRQP